MEVIINKNIFQNVLDNTTTGLQWAVIETENEIFYSTYQPQPQEPQSAVTQLIQGLYQNRPQEALRILRNPIFTNYSLSLLCRGMIVVAAKRSLVNKDFFHGNTDKITKQIQFQINKPDKDSVLCNKVLHIKDENSLNMWLRQSPSYPRYNSVRAALSDMNGKILLAAESDSKINKTFHAEVVLLQSYFAQNSKGFSNHTRLYTNLQCCKMCAAMFWHMHSNPWKNLEAFYYYPEQGSIARDTIFTSGGNWRRSVANNESEIYQSKEKLLSDLI